MLSYGLQYTAAIGLIVTGNDHIRNIERGGIPVQGTSHATRFAENEPSSRVVPWHQPHLKVQFCLS